MTNAATTGTPTPPTTDSKTITEAELFTSDIPKEEKELLNVYRRAKRMGYADITISIQEGKRVKLWLTEKFK